MRLSRLLFKGLDVIDDALIFGQHVVHNLGREVDRVQILEENAVERATELYDSLQKRYRKTRENFEQMSRTVAGPNYKERKS